MAEAIYTNSSHQRVIAIDYKGLLTVVSSNGTGGKACCTHFDAFDPGSNLHFGKLFFHTFQIASERHLFSIKRKEIIKK